MRSLGDVRVFFWLGIAMALGVVAAGCDTRSSAAECSGDQECPDAHRCVDGHCLSEAALRAVDLACSGCVEEDELAFGLATVAKTGFFADLVGVPTLAAANDLDDVDGRLSEVEAQLGENSDPCGIKRAVGTATNLGWFRSEQGVITIKGQDGQDLNPENPGCLWMRSALPERAGEVVLVRATANATFQDGALLGSDLEGWAFGVTMDRPWPDPMPVFVYAINGDDTSEGLRFGLSRNPAMSRTPAENKLGGKGSPPSRSDQENVFVVGDGSSAHAGKLAILVGATEMRKPEAAADWLLDAASDRAMGIGRDAVRAVLATSWTMPPGQNGAEEGKYFFVDLGEAPSWDDSSTNLHSYKIDGEGRVWASFRFQGTLDDIGSGPSLKLATPYRSVSSSAVYQMFGNCYVYRSEGDSTLTAVRWGPDVTNVIFQYHGIDAGNVVCDQLAAGGSFVWGSYGGWAY